jgi:hypothetical protein
MQLSQLNRTLKIPITYDSWILYSFLVTIQVKQFISLFTKNVATPQIKLYMENPTAYATDFHNFKTNVFIT